MLIFFKLFAYILLIFFIFGCSSSDKVLRKSVNKINIIKNTIKKSSIVKSNIMLLKEKKKRELIEESYNEYKIKIGDRLHIEVFGHPELSTSKTPSIISKTIVNSNGNIQLAKIGLLHVVGKGTEELREIITKKLSFFLVHPDVTVNAVFIKKNRYSLVGEFNKTQVIEKDYTMTLLEVISYGNGIKKKTADLRNAYVVRNKKVLPVNLYRLVEKGDISQNIDMRDRDTVVIPSYQSNQFIYIYSKVSKSTLPKIPLIDGKMTVLQAMAMSGLLDLKDTELDIKNVYVVRTEMDRIETFKIDVEKMLKGEAISFNLLGGDVIYITKSKVGTINQIVREFFPILSFINQTLMNIQQYRDLRDYLPLTQE